TSNKQKRTKVVHVQNSDNTKFSGTFWSKMRSYLPEQNKGTTNKTGVLGVRGAETTQSALEPHWEGDLDSEAVLVQDARILEKVEGFCRAGKQKIGIKAAEPLLTDAHDDVIRANTMLALAACHSTAGDAKQGKSYLRQFVQFYPKHPMANDVRAMLR
ncbi:MAG: hypothetical protein R8K21_02900, partial [Mariprofundales bacterium]